MTESDDSYDVIVLGAGVAGLVAARELVGSGARVSVLEARHRVGGRIHTVRSARAPLPVELGAELLHGQAPLTRELASEFGLVVVEGGGGTHWVSHRHTMEPDPSFGGRLDRALGAVKRAVSSKDRSFGEALQRTRLGAKDRALALSFVEGFDASDPTRASARALTVEEGSDRVGHLLGGYDALTTALAASLPRGTVKLHTVVSEVIWTKGEARVVSRSATGNVLRMRRAPKLVVTLPLGVLLAPVDAPGAVRFTPGLEAKRSIVDRLAMGNVVRITLRFRESFWHRAKNVRTHHRQALANLSFVHAPEAKLVTWWTQHPLTAPLLTAWAGGPKADELLSRGKNAIVETALESLAHTFKTSRSVLDDQLDGWFFHDWSTDPYAHGAYSYPLVGGANAARTLGAPLAGTLYFAGEATALPPRNGTVEGAIGSGLRVAAEITLRGSAAVRA